VSYNKLNSTNYATFRNYPSHKITNQHSGNGAQTFESSAKLCTTTHDHATNYLSNTRAAYSTETYAENNKFTTERKTNTVNYER